VDEEGGTGEEEGVGASNGAEVEGASDLHQDSNSSS